MKKSTLIILRITGTLLGTAAACAIAFPAMYVYYSLYAISTPTPNFSITNLNTLDYISEHPALKGYTNIAILGLDARNKSYDAGNRSDTIMVASINNDTKEIRLLSVYRDTFVEIPEHGLDKMTHAYAYGGPNLSVATLNHNLDLNISDYFCINWFAAAKAVDILGGIEIDIKSYELDEMNRVIDMTNESFTNKASHLTQSGKQMLNGIQAVAYSRIRKVGQGDFERTERQHMIMEASFKKAKQANFKQIISLINAITPEVRTSFRMPELFALAQPALKYQLVETAGFPFGKGGQLINGIYYGLSEDLSADVQNLHKYLFSVDNYNVSSTVKDIQSKINNKIVSIPSTSIDETDTTPTETEIQPASKMDDDLTDKKP